jgi:preprotein translocase subunit Sec61beta
MAGVNPYVEIGMLEEEKKGEEVPVIPSIAVIAAIAIAGVVAYAARRRKT